MGSAADVKTGLSELEWDAEVEQMRQEIGVLAAEGGGFEVREELSEDRHGSRKHVFSYSKPKPGPMSARQMVELVLKQAEPFCDQAGTLRLRRKKPLAQPDGIPQPIESWQTTVWFAKLCYDAGQEPLSPRDAKNVTLILEGMALENPEPVDWPEVIERDPVLHLLVLWLEGEPNWNGTTSQLLMRLRPFGEARGILATWDERWPKNPAQLGILLQRWQPWLAAAGIDYSSHRSNAARVHVFKRRSAGEPEVAGTSGADERKVGRYANLLMGKTDEEFQLSKAMTDRVVHPTVAMTDEDVRPTKGGGSVTAVTARDGDDSASRLSPSRATGFAASVSGNRDSGDSEKRIFAKVPGKKTASVTTGGPASAVPSGASSGATRKPDRRSSKADDTDDTSAQHRPNRRNDVGDQTP